MLTLIVYKIFYEKKTTIGWFKKCLQKCVSCHHEMRFGEGVWAGDSAQAPSSLQRDIWSRVRSRGTVHGRMCSVALKMLRMAGPDHRKWGSGKECGTCFFPSFDPDTVNGRTGPRTTACHSDFSTMAFTPMGLHSPVPCTWRLPTEQQARFDN